MKFLVLAAISFLSLTTSLTARASTAEKIQQVCGLSDTVYDYIATTAGEKSKTQYSLSATLGSARRMIIYNDDSWILTMEFLSQGAVEEDRTCIIAKGELNTQELATDIMKKSDWIGPQATPPKTKPAEPTAQEQKRAWMNEA